MSFCEGLCHQFAGHDDELRLYGPGMKWRMYGVWRMYLNIHNGSSITVNGLKDWTGHKINGLGWSLVLRIFDPLVASNQLINNSADLLF